jgi:hypothetical protein
MIKSIDELKEFILWSKSQKVKSIKVGDIVIEISDLAFIEGFQDLGTSEPDKKTPDISVPSTSTRLPDGNQQPAEEDEDLYWSAR